MVCHIQNPFVLDLCVLFVNTERKFVFWLILNESDFNFKRIFIYSLVCVPYFMFIVYSGLVSTAFRSSFYD